LFYFFSTIFKEVAYLT